MTAWRASLGQADSNAELASRSEFLLTRRLSIGVVVTVGDAALAGAAPQLLCRRTELG